MIVVSDTSPLHYLVVLGHVEILPRLYGRVLCPPEVIAECRHSQAPKRLREWASSPPEWLHILKAPAWEHSELDRLDAGEAAAIRLAREEQASLVLMDERKGRQVAERLGLVVAGVLSVLADAAQAGLLDFDSTVASLTANTNFRVSERVVAMIRLRLQSSD